MARGAYVSSRVGITRLTKVIGDRTEATRLIKEALFSEMINTRGRRQIYGDELPHIDANGKMILRDIMDSFPEITLSDPEEIPASFWKQSELYNRDRWNLEVGTVSSSGHRDDYIVYQELMLYEKDLNWLIETHSTTSKTKRERELRSEWKDWVAALVSLAHERRIHGRMTHEEVAKLIFDKYGEWGIPEEKPVTTVRPVLAEVLRRYRENPPDSP